MKDIQKKKDTDLVKHVEEKRAELRKFRFGVAGAGTRDVKAAKNAKKEIARTLTELNARLSSKEGKRTEANHKAK